MDDSRIIERLRAEAEQISIDTDVDALVDGSLATGHRRRTRRRIGAAVTALVVAGIAGTVVTFGVPSALLRGSPGFGPAGGALTAVPTPRAATPAPTPTAPSDPTPSDPTPSSPSPSPTSTPSSSSSGGPATPSTTGSVSGSPKQVRAVLTGLIPGAFTVVRSSSSRDTGSDGFDWENSAAMTIHDPAGTSYVFASIGSGGYDDGCFNLSHCTTTALPDGGMLWVTSSPAGDKAGPDRTFRYNRPDGGHISLMERTYDGGNGPVTRSSVPFTVAEGRALVTSPQWNRLFQG